MPMHKAVGNTDCWVNKWKLIYTDRPIIWFMNKPSSVKCHSWVYIYINPEPPNSSCFKSWGGLSTIICWSANLYRECIFLLFFGNLLWMCIYTAQLAMWSASLDTYWKVWHGGGNLLNNGKDLFLVKAGSGSSPTSVKNCPLVFHLLSDHLSAPQVPVRQRPPMSS